MAQREKEAHLRMAAQAGDIKVIQELLAEGVDVNATDGAGLSALHYAPQWLPHLKDKDYMGVARVLVEHGAAVDLDPGNGQTPLFEAVYHGCFPVVQYLHEQGAQVNATLDTNFNVLHQVAAKTEGRPQNFRLIVEQDGQQVVVTDPAEIRALGHGHPDDEYAELVQLTAFLIEHGADPDAVETDTHQTPLFNAAANGSEEIVVLLLATGRVTVNHQDSFGLTPLHYASRHGHVPVVKRLLAAGADPNRPEKYGFTPLHEAAENDHATVAEVLVRHGADPARGLTRAFDKYAAGDPPLEVARKAGRATTTKFLESI